MPKRVDEARATAAVAKRVLASMAKSGVPLTPENYQVWFTYVLGTNAELEVDMDAALESGKPLTAETNRDLHNKHFGAGKAERLVKRIYNQVRTILKDLIDRILATRSSASQYRDKLEDFSQGLGAAEHIAEIQGIVNKMIRDTDEMARSSVTLQEKLTEVTSQTESLRQQLEQAEKEALLDPLTGLHNRRAVERKLDDLCDNYMRGGSGFALVALDIDRFKLVNDHHGHQIGDEVLRVVASLLHDCLKGKDFPARYGGDEFFVLLPATNLDDASTVAQQVRRFISEKTLTLVKTGEQIGKVTVSVGVSSIRADDTAASVTERADKALYLAKNTGRNNVKTEKELGREGERTSGKASSPRTGDEPAKGV